MVVCPLFHVFGVKKRKSIPFKMAPQLLEVTAEYDEAVDFRRV